MQDIENAVRAILNSECLYKSTCEFVATHSRDENVDLYQELVYTFMDMEEDDARFEQLNDILDGLCGYCSPHNRIGTGDYGW